MPDEKNEGPEIGIAGLPKVWAVAVQLVGTFGLAVFLVLYYVLVLQPNEAARYDRLRESVEALLEVVRARQSLVTRQQAEQLEELYIQAVAPEVTRTIVEAMSRGRAQPDLARELDNVMMLKVDLLEGLTREDGGIISQQLTAKLKNAELPQRLAQFAATEWTMLPSEEVAIQVENTLRFAIRAAARAK